MEEERWCVTVSFVVKAEDGIEAESLIKLIIKEGILATAEENSVEMVEEFDVIDCEPAELP